MAFFRSSRTIGRSLIPSIGGIGILLLKFGALSVAWLSISRRAPAPLRKVRLRFSTALGSLYEARAGLRVAAARGYVSADDCTGVLAASDRICARVFGLNRR
jgi:hypothetical protein